MVHELYESFAPSLYKDHYVVRYYKMNNKRTTKTFSIKTYGSQAAAEEKAWDFFYSKYRNLRDHRIPPIISRQEFAQYE